MWQLSVLAWQATNQIWGSVVWHLGIVITTVREVQFFE